MFKRLMSRQIGWLFNLVKFFFASALFITSNTASKVVAQTSNDIWTTPLNLSRSGVASDPAILVDSNGVVHAVWQDNLANFVYARLEGDQWTAPITTDLNRLFDLPAVGDPRGQSQLVNYIGPNPMFVSGPGQNVFAFWVTPQGELFSSTVVNRDFAIYSAWESRALVAVNVASFGVSVDANGELHLAYFRTVDDPVPAGIYYVRSKNSGRNWTAPELVYGSPYFRSLGEGEANLSITATRVDDALRVYVAWDNQPRKQVLLAQSVDGGLNWEEPLLVAGPAPNSGLVGPFNIRVGSIDENIVLLWQSGQIGGACTQMYQSSTDAGVTWGDPETIIEDLLGCTQSNDFVAGAMNNPQAPLYFLTETQSQVFLAAWNGRQWSLPQAQSVLSGFEEPEIYTEVIYNCHRAYFGDDRLYVIGCDQGEGGDVWVTSRELKSDASWFKSPLWSQLLPVLDDNPEVQSFELVTTDDGITHAFFSQLQDPTIYYTFWDGESWSHITPVMKPPESEAIWPVIEPAIENNLFLIARSNKGTLYFSRAISKNAFVASSWSPPTQIEIDHNGEIDSVDIAWDATGTVYLAYSVAVNEGRGIYLVLSKDQGATWSDPVQVFDGVTAGFDVVGAPSLLAFGDGILHVIWSEQSFQEGGVSEPLSLYYARSENSGKAFSEVELIVEESVSWREFVVDGKGNLHLLWQQQAPFTTVWDQVSFDGGHSWEHPKGLPDAGVLTTVTQDSAGRLHLIGIDSGTLDHWLWDGNRWRSEASPSWSLPSQFESPVELLSTTINKQGKLIVVLTVPTSVDDTKERAILYSAREFDIPRTQTATQENLTQVPLQPTVVPTMTSSFEQLLTPVNTNDGAANTQNDMERNEENGTSPFIVALIPVAFLLISVVGIIIRRRKIALPTKITKN